MGRNSLIWILVFLLAVNVASAAEIRGTITDENGNPLIGAFAFTNYNGVNVGAVADGNGNFVITGLGLGTYSVTFSYLNVEQNRLVNTDHDVNVQFGSIELPEVIIEAQRPSLFPVIEAKPFNPYSDLGPIYGNSEFASQEPIPIYPGDYLVLDGSKSQFEHAPLENIYMNWYIGIPSFEFENLIENPDEFFYDNLKSILDNHKYFYPNLYKRRTSQIKIQLSREDFSSGDYYVVLKVTNPLDSFDEQFTWHKINIDETNRDYCSRGGCEESVISNEQEDTDLEIIEIPAEEQIITPFNPNDFPTTDQPQPLGTKAYNGRWVPLQVSSWSCQETDGFSGSSVYNNPIIASNCRIQTGLKPDTCGCMIDGVLTTCPVPTHVAEYSCNNNCQAPTILECSSGAFCVIEENGAGACKQPDYTSLESLTEMDREIEVEIISLDPRDEIVIKLDDNDLINNAFCSSFEYDLSQFEIEENSQTPTGSFIKQLTGFFSKITGKQAASPIARRIYSQKLETTAYSELANIRAYIPAVYFNEDGTRSNSRQARIMDKKVGSALLKNSRSTNDNINSLIASKQRSGEHSITESGLVIRENAILTGPEGGFVIKIPLDAYTAFVGIPSIQTNRFKDLTFILVETNEDHYFKIENNIYSVSKGLYMVPYPFYEDLEYSAINDPKEVDNELDAYYRIPFKIPSKRYDVGAGTGTEFGFCTTITGVWYLDVVFLTPSEADYFLRDISSTFEEGFRFPSKTFRYKQTNTNIEYYIIPLEEDYGDFKKAVYLVPKRSVISMDNEYNLRTRINKIQGIRFRPPTPNIEISYNVDVINKFLALQAGKKRLENRIPCVTDFAESIGELYNYIYNYRANTITRT